MRQALFGLFVWAALRGARSLLGTHLGRAEHVSLWFCSVLLCVCRGEAAEACSQGSISRCW